MAKPVIFGTVGQLVTGLMILHVISCASGEAQTDPRASSEKPANLDRALIVLHDEYVKFMETNQEPEQFVTQNPQLRIVDGQVLIDAVAKADVAELVSTLTVLGAIQISSYGQVVSCLFPIERLHRLESAEALQFARPARAATRPH